MTGNTPDAVYSRTAREGWNPIEIQRSRRREIIEYALVLHVHLIYDEQARQTHVLGPTRRERSVQVGGRRFELTSCFSPLISDRACRGLSCRRGSTLDRWCEARGRGGQEYGVKISSPGLELARGEMT